MIRRRNTEVREYLPSIHYGESTGEESGRCFTLSLSRRFFRSQDSYKKKLSEILCILTEDEIILVLLMLHIIMMHMFVDRWCRQLFCANKNKNKPQMFSQVATRYQSFAFILVTSSILNYVLKSFIYVIRNWSVCLSISNLMIVKVLLWGTDRFNCWIRSQPTVKSLF